ncbi:MAG TPA: transporter substrate-binding domain-containing protein [Armatimonadota bacterium]|nr:transporter substrate-binding domain-containing protein [Armatimonadota bacterium]
MIYLANYRLIIPTLLIFYILLAPSLAFQQIDQQPISPHTLRIAGDYNSPPDAFIDEKGQFTGFDIDIAKAIAHNAGMNIQFIPEAWPQAREELLHGKIDAVLGTYAIPELEKVLDYSIPYCIIQPTVFMWGRKTFDSTDSLAKKTIIVQRNTPTADILRIKFPSSRIIEINSVPNAFKLLSEKIYYCAIVDRQQGYYVVTKNHLKNINSFDSPILRLKSCFAVHEGDNDTLNIFNEGIMLLKETGEYQRIFSHWFGNIPQEKPSLNLLLVHIAFLSLILILILLWFWTLRRIIVNRTRSLNSELEHRKIIEDAHRESEEKYRTLVEQLPMITYVMEINPPMRFVFISPQIKDILGIAPEELLNDSKRFLELVHEDDIDMVQTNIERLKDKNAPPMGDGFSYKEHPRAVILGPCAGTHYLCC